MGIRAVKYLSPFLIYLGAIYSFTSNGIICFAPLIYSWIIIPFLELFLQPDQENLSEVEEDLAKRTIDRRRTQEITCAIKGRYQEPKPHLAFTGFKVLISQSSS